MADHIQWRFSHTLPNNQRCCMKDIQGHISACSFQKLFMELFPMNLSNTFLNHCLPLQPPMEANSQSLQPATERNTLFFSFKHILQFQ